MFYISKGQKDGKGRKKRGKSKEKKEDGPRRSGCANKIDEV